MASSAAALQVDALLGRGAAAAGQDGDPLAAMIREALPAALVSIVRVDLTPQTRPDAEQQTDIIKRLVIEASEAEQPGHAFLSASGYWPQNAPTAKE